ncbi:MAG: hypothetical protein WBQ25_05135 [Nitrososphaeraceae archaeon]
MPSIRVIVIPTTPTESIPHLGEVSPTKAIVIEGLSLAADTYITPFVRYTEVHKKIPNNERDITLCNRVVSTCINQSVRTESPLTRKISFTDEK